MWDFINEQKRLNTAEVCTLLTIPSDRLIVLDGPSACGKTYILHTLQSLLPQQVHIKTVEVLQETILRHDPAPIAPASCRILCFEDIDLMAGKPATQAAAAERILRWMDEYTVIVTGISIAQQLPDLWSRIPHERLALLQFTTP